MSDRTVSEPEASDGPAWRKSLGLSLGEHNGVSGILPLTVVVEEIIEWVRLASGIDAWKKGANRQSLQLDLDESAGAVGPALSSHIAGRFTVFRAALNRLCTAGSSVLSQPPGTRAGVVWTDLLSTGRELLEQLDSDAAVHASWDDLVAAAQDRSQARREYRPITELLFDQLRRRGLNPKWTFRELVRIVASDQVRTGGDDPPLDQRLSRARAVVGTPAPVEPTVVWLGYQGQLHLHLTAGRVSFYSANWAVPNVRDGGQDFPHRAELATLIEENPIFRVADLADEESDVDTLVRVDLGDTVPGDAVARAADIVDTILTVSIHYAGGTRLQLAQCGVVRSGQPGAFGLYAVHRETGFADDHYGAGITADAVQQHGPRIADALARAELPRFLAAAITVQTTADHPFSRDMALRTPSEADISNVIPLADRVVQHIAAHAAMDPKALFELLGEQYPHARWLTDLRRAAELCLSDNLHRDELRAELTREWFGSRSPRPWILFLADRRDGLLSVCRMEQERAWITRMFTSIGDHGVYRSLIDEYTAEARVLEARRGRVRNALVHGNPVSFAVVQSVREYASFLGGSALSRGLQSFFDNTPPATSLASRTDEFTAMDGGQDAASFWRARAAAPQPPAAAATAGPP